MQSGWRLRTATAVAVAAVLTGLLLVTAGTAGANSQGTPYPILRFHPEAGQVRLLIPTPACPASSPGCKWELFVNAVSTQFEH